jgi:transposase InsO family protein
LDVRLRGRPPKQSDFRDRHEVLEVYHEVGPHVGLPTLRTAFPTMSRGELSDLQGRYRRYILATHRRSVERLCWTLAGRVWAMDHAQPPEPIDGRFPRLLAVRDLASGMQLAWLPVEDETAETTAAVLTLLFTQHGPPLVLKSDNGSPFISHLLYELLERWQVVPLFSPLQMPEYNGACEAGNGTLKERTSWLAIRMAENLDASSPPSAPLWTSEVVEAARRQANEFSRPWGHRGPTRHERWAARPPLTTEERAGFAWMLARCYYEVRDSLAVHLSGRAAAPLARGNSQTVDAAAHEDQANRQPAPETSHSLLTSIGVVPGAVVHGASEDALIHRRAVRQALCEQGLLSITRRSIPLPIKFYKAAKIM